MVLLYYTCLCRVQLSSVHLRKVIEQGENYLVFILQECGRFDFVK